MINSGDFNSEKPKGLGLLPRTLLFFKVVFLEAYVAIITTIKNIRNFYFFYSNSSDPIRIKRIKSYNKRRLIRFFATSIIIACCIIFYNYFGFGVLKIKSGLDDYSIYFNGKTYDHVSKNKTFVIPVGYYPIEIKKDGYIEILDSTYISFLSFRTYDGNLPHTYYVSNFPAATDQRSYLAVGLDQKIISFSKASNCFYRITTTNKTYMATNNYSEKIEPCLPDLGENEVVSKVIYSPDKSKALLSIYDQDLIIYSNNYVYDLNNKSVKEISNTLENLDWLTNDLLVGVKVDSDQNNNAIISTLNLANNKITDIKTLTSPMAYVYGLPTNKNVYVSPGFDGKWAPFIINVDSKKESQISVKIPDGISSINPYKDGSKALLIAPPADYNKPVAKFYQISSEGIAKEIDISGNLDNITWLDDGSGFYYFKYNSDNNSFDITKYTLSDDKSSLINSIPIKFADSLGQILINNDQLVFPTGSNDLMGTSLK